MNTEISTCPMCDVGELSPVTFADEFKHGKKQLRVDGLEGFLCDSCGETSIFPRQIARNQIRIADAKRRQLGLLTGAEIMAIRAKLGLTQRQASSLFGGGDNAFSKYERGENIQSEPMDKLLRLMSAFPYMLVSLMEPSGEVRPHVEIVEVLSDDYEVCLMPMKASGKRFGFHNYFKKQRSAVASATGWQLHAA